MENETPPRPIELQKTPTADVVGFLVALALCFGTAAIGAALTNPESDWYKGLAKPSWNPPNWLFGPVWSTLYFLMATSAWLVWRKWTFKKARNAFFIFGCQLVLNVFWSLTFFREQRPTRALWVMFWLWVSSLFLFKEFKRLSRPAGYLLLPYIAWLSFAAGLNLAFCWLNNWI